MKNKNIILIGGFGLIGNALIKNKTFKNYNLIILDKRKIKNFRSVNTDFYLTDITKKKSILSNFRKIFSKYKKIDTVINLAYPKNNNWGKKFEQLNEKDIKDNLFLQLGSSILVSQVAIDFFLKQSYGSLILTSSIFGVAAPKFHNYFKTKISCPIEYSASKSGIIAITRYLAKLYGNRNIRVNCISPGGIKNNQPKSFLKKYKKSCLTKGMLDPVDICGAIDFLISDKSKFINGQNLIIDDGWTL